MIVCSKCHKNKVEKKGYCPPCRKEYNTQYRKNNEVEIRLQKQDYYFYNKDLFKKD